MLIVILRANTFYIGFEIMFLKILNKETKIPFLSNSDLFC